MAIDAYGNYSAAYTDPSSTTTTTTNEDKSILRKDDFLTLLLVELKYQDPTEPMDSEKILSQTSQLAALEASENTNKALEDLAASLTSSRDFSTISAIGKIADTGSNAIVLEDGTEPAFEIYFANDVESGTVDILDSDGNVIRSMSIESTSAGVEGFDWDGKDSEGRKVDEGIYYVTSTYSDTNGVSHETRVGLYPIESVRFEEGETLVKVGSSYIPFTSIKEVTEG